MNQRLHEIGEAEVDLPVMLDIHFANKLTEQRPGLSSILSHASHGTPPTISSPWELQACRASSRQNARA